MQAQQMACCKRSGAVDDRTPSSVVPRGPFPIRWRSLAAQAECPVVAAAHLCQKGIEGIGGATTADDVLKQRRTGGTDEHRCHVHPFSQCFSRFSCPRTITAATRSGSCRRQHVKEPAFRRRATRLRTAPGQQSHEAAIAGWRGTRAPTRYRRPAAALSPSCIHWTIMAAGDPGRCRSVSRRTMASSSKRLRAPRPTPPRGRHWHPEVHPRRGRFTIRRRHEQRGIRQRSLNIG